MATRVIASGALRPVRFTRHHEENHAPTIAGTTTIGIRAVQGSVVHEKT